MNKFVLFCIVFLSSTIELQTCFRFAFNPIRTRLLTPTGLRLDGIFKSENAIESIKEKLALPPSKLMEAVEKIPNYRVTVGEAAALSGLTFFETRKGLMTLASLVGGDLEVTESGDIIYSYPRNFRSILDQRSLGQKVNNISRFVLPKLYYLLRISVGLLLFTSIAATTAAILVLSSSSSSSDSDNRKSSSRSNSIYIDFNVFYDMLYYSRQRPPDGDRVRGKVSFLESFFSFVFGDGDPNEDFKSRQFQATAQLIQSRGGVVTAEELSCVLDAPSDPPIRDESSTVVNESWVLPALLQFNGEPIVKDSGQILYKFPELATPKQLLEKTTRKRFDSPYVPLEEPVPFSLASTENQVFAAGLGIFNIAAVQWLSALLKDPNVLVRNAGLATIANRALPLLGLYAVAYLAIPAVRFLYIQLKANPEIAMRNERREKWAKSINGNDVQEKLASAYRAAVELCREKAKERADTGADRVVYSTRDTGSDENLLQ